MLQALKKIPEFDLEGFGDYRQNVNGSHPAALLKKTHVVGGQPYLFGQLGLVQAPSYAE